MGVFETRTATGRENFTCHESGVCQVFILIISNGEKILGNVNVVVKGQVKRESSSLPVAVRVSKTRVLKLPISYTKPLKNPRVKKDVMMMMINNFKGVGKISCWH